MAVLKIPRSNIVSVSLSVKKDSEHHEKYLHSTTASCIILLKYSELLVESLSLFKQVFLKSRPPEKLIVLSD